IAYSTLTTFTGVTFANGDSMSAVANANGSVDVWQTTAANVTTYLGRSATPPVSTGTTFTGGGRVGMQVANGGRVDNFAGGTVL
ncbi:MAG: hypothetical protein ACXVKJ_08575, partial [Ilumatobacteraceae bacterium]